MDHADSEEIEEVAVPQERVTVEVKNDAINETATEAEAALIQCGAPVFQRGRHLVIPIVDRERSADGRETASPSLKVLNSKSLIDKLAEVADFQKWDGRSKRPVSCPPPSLVADILLNRAGEWHVRHVTGVISTPTVRPDGTILDREGYDEATGLHLMLHSTANFDEWKVPESPSKACAALKLARIRSLLDEFPFRSEVDEAVALSAILSGVARGALPVTPLHAADAPEAGTGKSFLWDLVAAFAIGNYCPVVDASRNEEEMDKRIVGLLARGLPVVSIDNVEWPLGSPLLCQATERPSLEIRPLGTSEMQRIDTRSMILASGNNLRLRNDMARRSLRTRMDAGTEKPYHRKFKRNPFLIVRQRRAFYVNAALTIIRAYQASSERVSLPPLQSYDRWSRMVREPLVWLGCADPVDSMKSIAEDDPERGRLLHVLAAWNRAFGVRAVSVNYVAKRVQPRDGRTEEHHLEVLRDALLEVAGWRGSLDSPRLGHWLSANRDRRIEAYQLQQSSKTRNGAKMWRVLGPAQDGQDTDDDENQSA